MNPQLIEVDRSEATRQYRLHCREARREGAPKHLAEMRRAYWHLKRGAKVIDLLGAFQEAGLNEDQTPKFAIARAEDKFVLYRKERGGELRLCSYPQRPDRWQGDRGTVIHFPAGSFPEWREQSGAPHYGIVAETLQAPVPIVPASVLQTLHTPDLSGLFIFWEVEKWSRVPPRDPFLLMRISKFLFAVIAQWDLTPLERAIIRARA